ncbi:hypothetical protein [Psychroserpens sp.]
MKQDIRGLFKVDDATGKQLPDNHKQEFYDKLKSSQTIRESISWIWLKISAAFLIALTVGSLVFFNNSNEVIVFPIVAQIEAIEDEYLKDIETEWDNFVAIADDEVLIERFRKKLEDLDYSYKEISERFKTDSNNILVIENLVNNLQNRLSLLRNIQQHIKILNQKSEHHENSI